MYLNGPIIRKLYDLDKTKDYIEIWETKSHSTDTTVDNILFPNSEIWDSASFLPEPAFVIHFKNLLVHSDSFSFIISCNKREDPNYTINAWRIFGSMDNKTWIPIFEETDCQDLKPYEEMQFKMNNTVFSWYKFTFQNTTYSNVVYLQQLEIYGKTFPYSRITIECTNYFHSLSSLSYIFLFYHS